MKTKILFFVMIVAGFTSCEDFLTQLPETTVPKDNFYKTEADFKQANIGIYQLLRAIYGGSDANASNGVLPDTYGAWDMGEARSDNTMFEYNIANRGYAGHEQVPLFIDDANGASIGVKYNNTYYMIQRANQVIQFIEDADISDEAYKNYKGQALFLRALGYFDLVQYFGGVPLVTVAPTSYDQTMKKRDTKEAVYEQILKDATDAAKLLPPVDKQEKGYASQGSAYMLLGNVYIVLQRWADAEDALKKVTGYSLMSDYAAIYDPANKNNAESIFEIQYWDDQTANVASGFAYQFLPILVDVSVIPGFPAGHSNNYGGWNIPTPEMIAAYETGDLRKDASIGFYTGAAPSEWAKPYTDMPYIKKYVHGAIQTGYCNDNWPVYRYAEALLFLAEACNEQSGKQAEALGYLNQVHAHPRTGLAAIATTDQAQLRELIQKERRVELAFENKRWLDLVRTGKAVEVMTAFGASFKADPTKYYYPAGVTPPAEVFTNIEKRLLFPIPQREIRLNPEIEQNSPDIY